MNRSRRTDSDREFRKSVATQLALHGAAKDAHAARVAIDILLSEIIRQTKEHGRVEIRGFGSFLHRTRDAHVTKNPKTGNPVNIPSKWKILFKPGKFCRGENA